MKYFIIILFLSSSLIGQDLGNIPVVDQNLLDVASIATVKTYGIETFDNRDKGIDGSVFYQDGWHAGEIKIVNSKVYNEYTFKYNVYDQNLIIRVEDRFYELPGMFVESFSFNQAIGFPDSGKKFIRKVSDEKTVYFMEVLEEGAFSLYKKSTIKLQKASYNPVLDTGDMNEKLQLKEKYFLAFDDKMVEIPSKKKKFEKAFSKKRSILKVFDSDDYDLSDENSLTDLVSQLNATTIK